MKHRTVLVGSRADCAAWLTEAGVEARNCVLVTSGLSVLQLRGRDPRDFDVVVLPSAERLHDWPEIRSEIDFVARLAGRVNASKGT